MGASSNSWRLCDEPPPSKFGRRIREKIDPPPERCFGEFWLVSRGERGPRAGPAAAACCNCGSCLTGAVRGGEPPARPSRSASEIPCPKAVAAESDRAPTAARIHPRSMIASLSRHVRKGEFRRCRLSTFSVARNKSISKRIPVAKDEKFASNGEVQARRCFVTRTESLTSVDLLASRPKAPGKAGRRQHIRRGSQGDWDRALRWR